jgi:serine/threonine protein kinase/Tol biopolymer transport system component
MTPEEHSRACELFDKIRDLPKEGQSDLLYQESARHKELRREVMNMLDADRRADLGGFLNRPALQDAANGIASFVNVPPIGTILAKYRLGKQVGAGGMGVVFEAEDIPLARRVALKILTRTATSHVDQHTEHFQREARAAGQLNHPHIASIFDAGSDQGFQYIAMEFVEGRTLRAFITAESRRIEAKTVLDLIGQIAAALSAAHQAGIIHRDIKPENIMLRPDGFIKVLDFGLAAVREPESGDAPNLLTRPGHLAGTIQYLSPEQVMGQPATPRSDLFSLGVVAYELATGVRPFPGLTDGAVFEAILHRDPPPPSAIRPALGTELDGLILGALEKEPELRFQNASDVRSYCRRLTRTSTSTPNPDARLPLLPPPVDRTPVVRPLPQAHRKIRRALAFIAALLFLLAGGFFWLTRPPAVPQVTGISQITHDGLLKEFFVTDGSRIYYATGERPEIKMFQVSSKGGDPIAIPRLDGMLPLDISKDGSQLLLLQHVKELNSGGRLWQADTLGGPPRRVGDLAVFDARWSPTGAEIVYCLGDDLWLALSDGSNSHLLTRFPADTRRPAWSPDGRSIRVTVGPDDDSSLWEVAADGSHPHPLFATSHEHSQNLRNPQPDAAKDGSWTPDGQYYLFSAEFPRADLWCSPLEPRWLFRHFRNAWAWTLASSGSVRLTNGPLLADYPQAATDGDRIFFRGRLDKAELVRYDSKTSEWHLFLNGLPATQVDYSRDEKWITFAHYRDGTIWRCASNGVGCTQLTSGSIFGIMPSFSPNGTQILFFGSPPGRPTHLYTVPTAGGALRQLTHGEAGPRGDDGGSWSADGSAILFGAQAADHSPNQAAYLPLQILNVRTGHTLKLPGSEGLWSARWSPDGRLIAAMNFPQSVLCLYDPLTHLTRPLTTIPASWPHWSRDSKSLYFGNNGFWYRVFIKDGKLEQVASLDKLKTAGWTLGWVSPAQDGSLISTSDAGSSEIYALDWNRQ